MPLGKLGNERMVSLDEETVTLIDRRKPIRCLVGDATVRSLISEVSVPFPVLQQGDAGPSVSALQLALAALGFDVGRVDGVFGEGTAAAVAQFQDGQGVVATGTVDDTTWELLAGQSFDPSEATRVNPQEFPSIARVVTFSGNIDGYLQDLGIDSTTISDDEPVG